MYIHVVMDILLYYGIIGCYVLYVMLLYDEVVLSVHVLIVGIMWRASDIWRGVLSYMSDIEVCMVGLDVLMLCCLMVYVCISILILGGIESSHKCHVCGILCHSHSLHVKCVIFTLLCL